MHGNKIIIILYIISPILSFYNISLTTTEIKNYTYSKILYTKFIGKPIDVLIDNCKAFENKDYFYIGSYLYIQSGNSKINVVLVWNDSIGEGDNISDSTEILYKDDNVFEQTI